MLAAVIAHVGRTQRLLIGHVMKKGEKPQSKKFQKQVEFIERHHEAGHTSNLIVVLDTHSDSFSGMLTAGNRLQWTIEQVANNYVGTTVLECMRDVSIVAREDELELEVLPGVKPWVGMARKERGGWRVLIMVSCGAAVREPLHWSFIVNLLNENMFDIIIGFGGLETIPLHVKNFVDNFVQQVATMGMGNIWETVRDVLILNPGVVVSNSIIAAYRSKQGRWRSTVPRDHWATPSVVEGMDANLNGAQDMSEERWIAQL
ncbi:hypothetical protein APHAL10511_003928 [Amanita phalloides]|nr:hypothetical protein APHAL10511_003928 [Amanita phalloides]